MITNQLIDYIKNQISNGITPEQIKNALIASGWQAKDIEEAFKSINLSQFPNLNETQQDLNSQPNSPALQKFNLKLIAIIIVIGVILVGGAAFAYFTYLRPLSVEEVTSRMLENLSNIKSFNFNYNYSAIQSINVQNITQNSSKQPYSNTNQTINTNINATGTEDLSDSQNIKLELTLNPFISSPGLTLSPSIKIIKISDKIYLKINNIPNLGFISPTILENKWIETDLNKLNQEFQNTPLGQIQNQINQQITQASSSQFKLSPDQIANIKEAILNSGVLDFKAALPDENIGGVNTYHYQFVLNKDKLVALVTKIGQIIKNNQSLSQDDLNNIQNFKNSLNNNISLSPIDIWIGKKDFFPYQFSLSGSVLNLPANGDTVSWTLLLDFSNFNQPTNIVAPLNTISLEDLIKEIFNTSAKQ